MLKDIGDTYKKTGFLHHAYLIDESLGADLLSLIETDILKELKSNPDFTHIVCDTFGIDDGRRLKEFSSRRAVTGRKITVITFVSMTREAQNALLKLFEEPTKNTHFFLVTSQIERILPTLLSRLCVIRDHAETSSNSEGEKFLKMKAPERIDYLKPMIEEKDKGKALKFLNELTAFLRLELIKKPEKETAASLKELTKYRGYLMDRGSSVKMILEHIALAL